MKITIGQLLVNEALPPDMRDPSRVLDKKEIGKLFTELAKRYPDRYDEISSRLSDISREVAYRQGGFSFKFSDLKPPEAVKRERQRLEKKIEAIVNDPRLTLNEKNDRVVEETSKAHQKIQKLTYEELVKQKNPFALQVLSGMRGNKQQLQRLLGADLIYDDHRGNPIPFPILRSFAEGLSPADWFASAFGARRGLIHVKLSTPEAGSMSKQLSQASHRLVVVPEPEEDLPDGLGLPVDVDDPDNEGALLAKAAGGFPKNTPLTPKVISQLKDQGIDQVLVRSPIVGGPESGVYAHDVGIREQGKLPDVGEQVGLTAALALSEGLTQGAISAKHSGGAKGSEGTVTGFKLVDRQVQVPKHFPGGATHAEIDGRVDRIAPAPAGGYNVYINGEEHYVPPERELKVKQGDTVEAGDVLSSGIPNPAKIVEHKGIGEGRRYLVNALRDTYRSVGMTYLRRNGELLARGLIDHVEFEEPSGDFYPGDVVNYGYLAKQWKPREGYRATTPKQAVGKYLERPVLHYTVGTKVRPSMLPYLEKFGIKSVDVHDEPPPFKPVMIRAMASMQYDPDWLTRMFGSGQRKSLLSATRLGGTSDTRSTSFVPAAASGAAFQPSPYLPLDKQVQTAALSAPQKEKPKRWSILSPIGPPVGGK